MELLFIYALIGLCFGFCYTTLYINDKIKEGKVMLAVILSVGLLVLLPLVALLWPIVLIRRASNL